MGVLAYRAEKLFRNDDHHFHIAGLFTVNNQDVEVLAIVVLKYFSKCSQVTSEI